MADGGGCLPLGGMEENGMRLQSTISKFLTHRILHFILTGGYKGYGLGMMVEILCATMSGSEFGPNVRIWKTRDKIANYVRR